MTHLFVSHSARDGGAIAQQLFPARDAAGHRCWIAPRTSTELNGASGRLREFEDSVHADYP
jgi:hypothetical protein